MKGRCTTGSSFQVQGENSLRRPGARVVVRARGAVAELSQAALDPHRFPGPETRWKQVVPLGTGVHTPDAQPPPVRSIDSYPLVEADGQVHFIYRGPGKDMAIAGDIIGHRQEPPMTRVPGTDLRYFSTTLEPDARVNYLFIRDYEEMTDPLNPRETVTSVVKSEMEPTFGRSSGMPISWLGMPGRKPA